MEDSFYDELFSHFMAVAWREAPSVAASEVTCREIFHDRVLFPMRVGSMEEAEARIKGEGRRFATVKAYKNYLHTIFKNAIIDHLRERGRDGKRKESVDDERDAQLSDIQDFSDDKAIREKFMEIFSALTREEKRLLSLRFTENKTLVEIGKVLGVSKSTVERRERTIEAKLFSFFESSKDDYDEKDILTVLARVLDRADEKEAKL